MDLQTVLMQIRVMGRTRFREMVRHRSDLLKVELHRPKERRWESRTLCKLTNQGIKYLSPLKSFHSPTYAAAEAEVLKVTLETRAFWIARYSEPTVNWFDNVGFILVQSPIICHNALKAVVTCSPC